MSVNMVMMLIGVIVFVAVFVLFHAVIHLLRKWSGKNKRQKSKRQYVYIDENDNEDIVEFDDDEFIELEDLPLEFIDDIDDDETDCFEIEEQTQDETVSLEPTIGQEHELFCLIKNAVGKSGLGRGEVQKHVIEKGYMFINKMTSLLRELAGYKPEKSLPKLQTASYIQKYRETFQPKVSSARAVWRQVWLFVLVLLAFAIYNLYPTVETEVVSIYTDWQDAKLEEQYQSQQKLVERRKATKLLFGIVLKFRQDETARLGKNILLVIKLDNRKENHDETGLYTLRVKGSSSALDLLLVSLQNGKHVQFTRYPELKSTHRGDIDVKEIAVIK